MYSHALPRRVRWGRFLPLVFIAVVVSTVVLLPPQLRPAAYNQHMFVQQDQDQGSYVRQQLSRMGKKDSGDDSHLLVDDAATGPATDDEKPLTEVSTTSSSPQKIEGQKTEQGPTSTGATATGSSSAVDKRSGSKDHKKALDSTAPGKHAEGTSRNQEHGRRHSSNAFASSGGQNTDAVNRSQGCPVTIEFAVIVVFHAKLHDRLYSGLEIVPPLPPPNGKKENSTLGFLENLRSLVWANRTVPTTTTNSKTSSTVLPSGGTSSLYTTSQFSTSGSSSEKRQKIDILFVAANPNVTKKYSVRFSNNVIKEWELPGYDSTIGPSLNEYGVMNTLYRSNVTLGLVKNHNSTNSGDGHHSSGDLFTALNSMQKSSSSPQRSFAGGSKGSRFGGGGSLPVQEIKGGQRDNFLKNASNATTCGGREELIGIFQYDMRLDHTLFDMIRKRVQKAAAQHTENIRKGGAKKVLVLEAGKSRPFMRNRKKQVEKNIVEIVPKCCLFYVGEFPTKYLLYNPLGRLLLKLYNEFHNTSYHLSDLPSHSVLDAFVIPVIHYNHILPFLRAVMKKVMANDPTLLKAAKELHQGEATMSSVPSSFQQQQQAQDARTAESTLRSDGEKTSAIRVEGNSSSSINGSRTDRNGTGNIVQVNTNSTNMLSMDQGSEDEDEDPRLEVMERALALALGLEVDLYPVQMPLRHERIGPKR